MKIALIGMMGSGKIKLGQILAARRGIDFVDLERDGGLLRMCGKGEKENQQEDDEGTRMF